MSTGLHPTEPHEGAYDPELPFLETLEHEIRRSALRAAHRRELRGEARPGRAPAQAAPQRRGARMGLAGVSRVSRRSLTLVVLLCLVGASAFGAREILSSENPDPAIVHQGPSVLVAGGHAGADDWSLRLYRREAALCSEFVVGETEASRCSPAPAPGAATAVSVVSPLRRYVFGVSGAEVTRVSVRVGGSVEVVTTQAPTRQRIHAAELPPGARWFVAVLDRPANSPDPPAVTQALDYKHHPIGQTETSCVETTDPLPCGR